MKPVELKKDIYWVGAVDFDIRNFHHYSRSPEGSTYNAYLVCDEKNVLFDTVNVHEFGTLVKHISEIIEPEKIDYIVCNHLEQDHSGALPRMVKLCKPEKIFCSPMGYKSMTNIYDTTGWPIEVVKDGDRINIGKRNITFLETRMLHWPDSMVSYLEEDKVLISNDAFGQNIASSFRFADETDHKTILNATKGYYYNIVLPYSPQVLKTLKRVVDMGLQIDVIAPDHGLIFRTPEDVAFIINTYKELAEQKPVCSAVIAYDSMWGGTSKLAEAVADGLADEGVPFVMYNLQNTHPSEVTTALADAGALILGSPTRNNMPMVNMVGCIAHIKGLRPQNLVGAAFGCYGWSGESPKMLTEALADMKVEVVADPVKCYFNPQEEDLANARALGVAVARALKEKCAQ